MFVRWAHWIGSTYAEEFESLLVIKCCMIEWLWIADTWFIPKHFQMTSSHHAITTYFIRLIAS
jgi:hypothetical protein